MLRCRFELIVFDSSTEDVKLEGEIQEFTCDVAGLEYKENDYNIRNLLFHAIQKRIEITVKAPKGIIIETVKA